MSYDFFLFYLAAFIGLGLVVGFFLLVLAYKNRIALRSLLAPIRIRQHHALVKPITLRGAQPPHSSQA